MLKSEKIYTNNVNCLKDSTANVLALMTTLIRHTELRSILDNKDYKDGKEALEKAHSDIDILACEEDVINEVLKLDAGAFIKKRDEVNALNKELSELPSFEEVAGLCSTDKTHIYLLAHMCYSRVQLDVLDLFDTDKGGIDISAPIKAYYKSGKIKDTKESLRTICHKLVGQEGTYFYGFSPKRADFEAEDLRHFLSYFGNRAKRPNTKNNDGTFDWVDCSSNKPIIIKAFTDLLAVVLDNASKHNVIKEQETKEKEPVNA